MNLKIIEQHMLSGDKLLFGGRSSESRKIMIASSVFQPTPARYSHIETVVVGGGELFAFGAVEAGCVVQPLRKRIESYDGTVSLRMVVDLSGVDRDAVAQRLIQRFEGTPYELNRKELVGAALKIFQSGLEDLSSIFCAELANEFDQEAGWRDHAHPSNADAPADFQDDRRKRLIGAYMLPEIILKG